MSESPNLTLDTIDGRAVETPADLSQNLDELSDFQLAIGALAGLRMTTANDASERSHRRYDDRNHRMHEHRLAETFGMEEKSSEQQHDEEKGMGHQVWVRSPVHYHMADGKAQPPSTQTPIESQKSMNPLLPLIAGLALGAVPTAGLLGYFLANRDKTPPAATGKDTDSTYKVEKWIPDGSQITTE